MDENKQSQHILIIEDDPAVAHSLQDGLAREGYIICRLREKVELEPSRPSLILTVPGIGYRLVKG